MMSMRGSPLRPEGGGAKKGPKLPGGGTEGGGIGKLKTCFCDLLSPLLRVGSSYLLSLSSVEGGVGSKGGAREVSCIATRRGGGGTLVSGGVGNRG
jgi:hypothetical protein